MNRFFEVIKNFFRKQFNTVKAKSVILGIKSMINSYNKTILRISTEIGKLTNVQTKYNERVEKYRNMLNELKEDLNNGNV